MNKKIILADASPIIIFCRTENLLLLKNTLGRIIVPQAVFHEITSSNQPGSQAFMSGIQNNLIEIITDPDMHDHKNLLDILDRGEATAIVLAQQHNMGLLMDEKKGRKIAQKMNIKVIGTIGVLRLAKRKKLIKKIKPLIEKFQQHGYFLSQELIQNVLAMEKE